MTAGLPGAGIAGLFYLVCALLMPLVAGARALLGRARSKQMRHTPRFISTHVIFAIAMLASLWIVALIVGWVIAWGSPASATGSRELAANLPATIARGVVWITAGTLVAVLVLVELLRLVLGGRARSRTSQIGVIVALMAGSATTLAGQAPQPATAPDVAALVARADEAFDDGDKARAVSLYEAVLAASPDHPRALYRLGVLRRDDPVRAIKFFEAYSRVMPRDAWGHLALSSSLADAGRFDEAMAAYERADALEPADRDIALGRPRLLARAGQPRLALTAYRDWLASHPDDIEAWRELAGVAERLRRWPSAADALTRVHDAEPDDERVAERLTAARARAAPALEFGGIGIGETDIATVGFQAGGDVAAGDVARLGGLWQRRHIDSYGQVVRSDRWMGLFVAQPTPELRVQVSAGLVRRAENIDGGLVVTSPEARVRVRRRFAADRGGVDVRGQFGPVDATPALALDELTRQLLSAAFEVPVGGRWRARGIGSVWFMSRPEEEANRAFRIGGSLAFQAAPGVNVSGGWQQSRYRDPGIGYYAPERAELVEAGVDLEREHGILTISLDAGAGVQRVQEHGGQMGAWDLALRGWTMLAWTLAPGRQLAVEVEAYDSRVTDRVVSVTDRWRYASVTGSFRIAIR